MLAAADELLPMGIEMPAGPFRRLRELAAAVWLDDAGEARRIAIQNAREESWKTASANGHVDRVERVTGIEPA